MRRMIALSMQLLLAAALVTACNSGGVMGRGAGSETEPGNGDDDDDDDGSSPGDDDDDDGDEPSEPFCEIVWLAPGSASGKANLYVVEVLLSDWTTGTKTFGENAEGYFILDEDEASDSAADFAYAPSGTFELTVSGSTPGSSVTFTDTSSQSYDSETATGVASDGTGDFDGTLIDPESEDPGTGSGSISITYGAASYTLGADGAAAYCITDLGSERGEERTGTE